MKPEDQRGFIKAETECGIWGSIGLIGWSFLKLIFTAYLLCEWPLIWSTQLQISQLKNVLKYFVFIQLVFGQQDVCEGYARFGHRIRSALAGSRTLIKGSEKDHNVWLRHNWKSTSSGQYILILKNLVMNKNNGVVHKWCHTISDNFWYPSSHCHVFNT